MDKIFLEGKNIYLRTLCLQNATQEYTDWLNSEVICQYNSHHRFPNTLAKTTDYIDSQSSSQDSIILAIYDKTTKKHIGNVGLQSINLIGIFYNLMFICYNAFNIYFFKCFLYRT